MKKLVAGFLCGSLFFSGVSYAASGSLKADIANLKVLINGTEQKFSTKPVVIDGTTYLPLREVSKAFGYSVNYKNGTITLNEGQATSGSTSPTQTSDKYTKLSSDALKLNVNGKYYGLSMGTGLYVDGSEAYSSFDAGMIDLIVAIASKDYIIYETHNDNADFITTDYFASRYKYLEIIEKQKSYRLINPSNSKTYEIVTNKDSSKGVTYYATENQHLVPLNKLFKDLGLNAEAKYDAANKQVNLILK
ncbi:copper amine oxidase N-terminal domain-containing protein [Saccharibacillus endophyticus]|uniref:Copper amine oxidase-like N-terminal domain-containing protein n=1 Tax=Saccharibacillus endophyticus TaxID=2060666 RepID=A0ABQ2A018_9BACL|nr:copper amine oxidase N-terminal domain-containing protein [Saccharibacillus endophyticus]GGH81816.1 hypothetical protein GCM10007362_32190 [Saccharibacillus endophyticus]